jgi:hypothetical protein
MPLVHIHDLNYQQHVIDPVVDGERKARGLAPRDYRIQPLAGSPYAHRVDFPLIDQAEWPGRIQEMVASKSRLSDIRGNIPSRDQNGRGYCWMHSGVSALLLLRARDNQPYADLSAYGPSCLIKNYRDEGGWGAAGLEWLVQHGCPTSKTWPQKSTARSNDTPAMRAEMNKYKVLEGYWDLDAAAHSRNLSFAQTITLLLCRIPVIQDHNWWGHSICGADPVDGAQQWGLSRAETGKLLAMSEFDAVWGMTDPVLAGTGILIWNSWGEGWGERGMGLLSGRKAIPDGASAPRVASAMAA